MVSVKTDNQGMIKFARNPEFYKRTKHIEVRFEYIRYCYLDVIIDIDIVYVSTDE